MAGLGLQLECAGEGGERDSDAGECAFASSTISPFRILRLLLRLDTLPQALDGARGETPRIPEHMRMAPYQFFIQGFDHVGEFERALLLRHTGVKNYLKQEV